MVWSPQNPFDEFWTLWNFFWYVPLNQILKSFFCRDPLADTLIKKSHVSQENFCLYVTFGLRYGVLLHSVPKMKKVQQIKMPVRILA